MKHIKWHLMLYWQKKNNRQITIILYNPLILLAKIHTNSSWQIFL
jgi:hypothetical protein